MVPGKYTFKVRSYECGAAGVATLPTVCNYLQEAASLNAEELGFSKLDFDAAGANISWVLTRLVVKMARYPKWNEEVTVVTFPRGGRRIVAWRDFEILDASGARLGAASSEWMLIDLATRRIQPLPESVFACLDPGLAPVLGPDPFTPRLKFPAGGASGAPRAFRAQHAHIDMNGHVNNVHYVAWLLEPLGAQANRAELEVAFRSETLVGDEVRVETAAADGATYHRVFAPDGKDHVVAVTRGECPAPAEGAK